MRWHARSGSRSRRSADVSRAVDDPIAGRARAGSRSAAGHPSLAKLAQGTVCKILADHAVKPHKVRCCLEQRDPEFEPKMAEILCVYRMAR
jgi:hypothetical protein